MTVNQRVAGSSPASGAKPHTSVGLFLYKNGLFSAKNALFVILTYQRLYFQILGFTGFFVKLHGVLLQICNRVSWLNH
ncbi:hypothetical protein Mucpa_2371 [Mucilaginibacter paludis DSM 18603]|uniref:Uncharacterized protein n=1 Tax=Mucilaginibacter paludis DSM 18603 TaxID=714943 RepID=H1YI66_9SPHI|nr:hypothetical protein Mucpa_2371 [Mucilaginibacter paludis DSM 18603]